MDRLHAYLYFLEGLMPALDENAEARCALAGGIRQVSSLLHDIEPEFARADVYAQLLRIRILADTAGAEPLDREAAAEARTLVEFQAVSADPRIDGGYWFGRKNGVWLPHVNPVSTAFAIEALDLWERPAGAKEPGRPRI
jgi:hypothetical protein